MDQYVFKLELNMLFFDYMELVYLVKDSGNERLLLYLEKMKKIAEDEANEKINWK